MKMKTVFRILTTPSCWTRNYKTDKTVDRFVRSIVENKDEVELIGHNDCNIYLKFRGKIFGMWIANRWYAYLNRINLIADIKYPYRYERQCERRLPSREVSSDMRVDPSDDIRTDPPISRFMQVYCS